MDQKDLNESYEYNLKLYNESIRKDLDISLTSTIPIQKNLMKTILWINTSIIGLVVLSFKEHFSDIFMAIPFVLSLFSILIILVSLKDGRVKYFGSPKIEELNNLQEDEYMKYRGLLNLSQSYKIAFDNNIRIVKDRGGKIAIAINFTILSIISIAILSITYYSLNFIKEENMSNEDKTEVTISRPTKASKTAKPSISVATNNTTMDYISVERRVSIQKSESTKKPQDKKNSNNQE